MNTPKHKIFLSFHSEDMHRKEQFERLFHQDAEAVISRSVKDGDISDLLNTETIRQKIRDEYLRESTVTIVLIGRETYGRKFVDWEIASSLRDTQYNKRSGLIGIFLPDSGMSADRYYSDLIPPRLADNLPNGFAKLYNWTGDPLTIRRWVHEAYERKSIINPDNSRPSFVRNR